MRKDLTLASKEGHKEIYGVLLTISEKVTARRRRRNEIIEMEKKEQQCQDTQQWHKNLTKIYPKKNKRRASQQRLINVKPRIFHRFYKKTK